MKSGSEVRCEWTCEGGPKFIRVGADGALTVTAESVCQYVLPYRWLTGLLFLSGRKILFLGKKSVFYVLFGFPMA